MRDSMIIYRSFYESIKGLKKENQADVWAAIFEYSLNFNEIKLQGISKTIFTLIKPQLDANLKKYKNGTTPKNLPKQNTSKTEAKDKQNISETEANDNVNDNDNDNVNDNASASKSGSDTEAPTEKWFIERWKAARLHYDKMPTGFEKLSQYERSLFKDVVKDFSKKQIECAIKGLFFQKTVPAVRVRPDWILKPENFEKMLDCALNDNKLFEDKKPEASATPKFKVGDV